MKQRKRRRNQEWAKAWAPRRYPVRPTPVSTIVGGFEPEISPTGACLSTQFPHVMLF